MALTLMAEIQGDTFAQAVQLGMAIKRPVQLVYPREEDFTHDQYRPMAAVRVRSSQNFLRAS